MSYEPGCYGDGAFGHQHTRERCADIVAAVLATQGEERTDLCALVINLRDAMTDDASEEEEACDFLARSAAVPGCIWGWQDGDFGLWVNESEET
jgi:hypothetical protein